MNKGKFASLIMLGVFSAGVASSSAVSAHGNKNLASVVDNKGASSHDDSVPIDPKVSNEPMVDADETNIDAETTTEEEVQTISLENKTDLPENLDKEDNKNRDYLFVDKTKKVKKVNLAKVLAIATGGGAALGGATFGISKLVKSSRDEKKDEPVIDNDDKKEEPIQDNPDDSPDKKVKPTYFILASITGLLCIWVLFCFIRTVRIMSTDPPSGHIYFKPFFGLFENRSTSYISEPGLKMFVYYLGVYFIASKDVKINH